jgi:hypothetical protein
MRRKTVLARVAVAARVLVTVKDGKFRLLPE